MTAYICVLVFLTGPTCSEEARKYCDTCEGYCGENLHMKCDLFVVFFCNDFWSTMTQDDRVTFVAETAKGRVKKEALLNDSDSLWMEFRHEHIAKVLSDLGK